MKSIEFILAEIDLRARYDALFEECPNAFIQQSTYWAEVIQEIGPDKPIFLLCEHNGQAIAGLPLYLYENPHGNVLISVPQAGPMGGVFIRDGIPDDVTAQAYKCLLEKAIEVASMNCCICISLITNPFTQDLRHYESSFMPDLVFENFTQHIDVPKMVVNGEIQLKDYQSRSTSAYIGPRIQKALNAGFEVDFNYSKENSDATYQLHLDRFAELGVAPIRKEIVENIRTRLAPQGKAMLVTVKKDGEVASGCIYILHRNILDVFIISGNNAFKAAAPNFLNHDHSIRMAAKKGIQIFNWQSSPNRESGVYRYKKEWGSIDTPYYFLTKLLCPPSRIAAMGIATLKAEYPMHFIVPFQAFTSGFECKYFSKTSSAR